MRRLEVEETRNRKKAVSLSLLAHLGFVGYLTAAVVVPEDPVGSGYTTVEFVEAYQGKQLEIPVKGTDARNTKSQQLAQRKAKKSPKKPAAKKPEPVTEAVAEVEKSEVLVKKNAKSTKTPPQPQASKVAKAEKKLEKLPDSLPDKALDESLERELADIEKEDNKTDSGKDRFEQGNSKVNIAEQRADYGKVDAVRRAEELTPIAGNRMPRYPEDAALKRYQPTVEIDFYVGPDGRVGDIRFVNAARMGSVNKSVLEAVRTWRFRPGKIGYFRKEIEFVLKGPSRILPERLKRQNIRAGL